MSRTESAALPVVLVGAGHRAASLYGPILKGPLADRLQLVALVSRSPGRLELLADELQVPGFLDLETAVRERGARAAIVCVSAHENHRVAEQVIDLGLPALLETPLALQLDDARRLAARIRSSGLPVEVAEQNPRAPTQWFWRRIVEEGFIGEPRLVVSDRAGYRYHATAVARSLLGRPAGLRAVGLRSIFSLDLGRDEPTTIHSGVLSVEGGAVFQLNDGEGVHVAQSPWPVGGWSVLGNGGGLSSDDEVRAHHGGALRTLPVERLCRDIDGVRVTQRILLHADILLESCSPLPDAPLDDDGQAVARCLLDWLDRIEGGKSPSCWSAGDALEDLAWITALERSCLLGGVPIQVEGAG